MSSPSLEELTKTIEELRNKVDALSTPLEDALATRVFQKSIGQFRKWILWWLALVAAGLLFLGYKGYEDAINLGHKQASEYLHSRTMESLQEEIKSDVAKFGEEVKKDLKQSALATASKLDADSAKLLSEAQLKLDERLRSFATQLGVPQLPAKITEKQAAKQPGFAYYGIRSPDGWNELYFKRISGDPEAMPEPEDIVEATAPVNARKGVIEYDSARGGWVNKNTIGLIKPGEQLRVLKVIRVAGSFIWIEFNPKP